MATEMVETIAVEKESVVESAEGEGAEVVAVDEAAEVLP